MSSSFDLRRHIGALAAAAVVNAVALWPAAAAAQGIGRPATAAELAAWDIDVRPDFKGLPAGSGSVAQGQVVWESQCAGCHGVFAESAEVFGPLVGGTTAADIASGHAARLTDPGYPSRSMLMVLPTVSTLWDTVRRAMPWNKPKSLRTDEVYAVTAYLLHLGGVLPEDFVLDERSIAVAQQRLPNRNGMTTAHALWPGAEFGGAKRPDVPGKACMKHCAGVPVIRSVLPDFARNAHGNLAQQSRLVGAQHGVDTSGPAASPPAQAAPPGGSIGR